MNSPNRIPHENPSHRPSSLPVIPPDDAVSAPRRRPARRPRLAAGKPFVPVDVPLPPPRERTLPLLLFGTLLAVGAAVLLLPAIRSCTEGGGEDPDRLPGGVIGGSLTPPADTAPLLGESQTHPIDATDSESAWDGDEATNSETDGETEPEIETPPESETHPMSVIPPPESLPDESDRETDPPDSESDTYPALPPESTVEPESETQSEAPPESETDPLTDTEAETETETSPSETDTSMPEGAFPIIRADLSEPDRSAGYIHSTADRLPPSIPGEGTRLWSTSGRPTVLIVHTHPYEGYHDGSNWYDPATGSFAQTEGANASDGVVALGATLARALREAGLTVIHLRVPVAEGASAADTYARTEETVRYYCELYPDIGLVLDLRRSAELSPDGEILRTTGQYEGKDCAQVRLSVSGDRATDTVSRDIAVAVALRRALWAEEPSISRPVWVKSGTGLAGDMDRVAMLTVELGSAGNSFAEAEGLLSPLGKAIAALAKK